MGRKMIRIFFILMITAWLCFTTQGCSYKAWYEGLQENQRQDCYEQKNRQDIQKCIENLNHQSYEQYRKSMEK